MNPEIQPAKTQVGSKCYTAAQIAAALGISKRGALYALRGIPAEQTLIIHGICAQAWGFCALPAQIQERLESRATRRGLRNAEQLLVAPIRAWGSPVPADKVGPANLEKAVKLQRALAPALARMSDLELSEAEFERRGVADYAAAFGFEISARHWRRLLKRTLERDGGAEDFARVEIYLDERIAIEKQPAPSAAAFAAGAELNSVRAAFQNPAEPSTAEIAYYWTRTFELFEEETASGKPAKKAKRLLLEFLGSEAPFLADTAAGLRKQFERKYASWIAGDRKPSAVEDQRHEKSGRFRGQGLCAADRDRIIGKAVLFHGGRLSPAWRELRNSAELSQETLGYYLANSTDKSYVPRKVRDQVRHEIEAMADIHHGPRQAQLNGAHISRDWSGVAAGDWYQADDCTLPIYYYEPNEEGWFTLWRGQCLLMMDLRTTRILGYALLSSRNYNSLAIRTVTTRVCDEHGLPRRGFYFERGIWQSSKILKGDRTAALSLPEAEKGLRDLGLRFIHAKLPRAKPVEGVLGAVQNLMEGEPGYCGRDEKSDKYERVQRAKLLVEARKMEPAGHFLSASEWLGRLSEICGNYNAEPQQGKMLGNLSPDAAFAKLQRRDDPQTKFDASCRYLLAHHRRPVRVTANGITLRFGRQVYTYRDGQTGHHIGETVFAWFNPETPEVLCVTDTKCQNPFAVERSPDVPAIVAPAEIMAQEMSRIAAHHAHTKAYYRTLRAQFAPQFRRNLVNAETAELGAEMRQQTEAVRARVTEETRRVNRAQRAARDIGMTLSPDARRRPETAAALEDLRTLLANEKGTES